MKTLKDEKEKMNGWVQQMFFFATQCIYCPMKQWKSCNNSITSFVGTKDSVISLISCLPTPAYTFFINPALKFILLFPASFEKRILFQATTWQAFNSASLSTDCLNNLLNQFWYHRRVKQASSADLVCESLMKN